MDAGDAGGVEPVAGGREGRAVERIARDGMAGGGEVAADLVGDAGKDDDVEEGEGGTAPDGIPEGGGGKNVARGKTVWIAGDGHFAWRAGLVDEGGVEGTGGVDGAVDEGEVVFFDGEGLELAAEGRVGGEIFCGEDEAGGVYVEPVDQGGEEPVFADVGEGGMACDEGVGEGVGFGPADGMGGLAGGLVEGEQGFVFVDDAQGQFGVGAEAEVGGFGEVAAEDGVAGGEAGAFFGGARVEEDLAGGEEFFEGGAVEPGVGVEEETVEAGAGCVGCVLGVGDHGMEGGGGSVRGAGRGWGLAREDFFWFLAARKPTGIFSALPFRSRPLADTSPARVVRKAASSENLPDIFANSLAKPQKKSSASTSCGLRAGVIPKRGVFHRWTEIFHGVENGGFGGWRAAKRMGGRGGDGGWRERISFGFWRRENQPASFPRCRFAADPSRTRVPRGSSAASTSCGQASFRNVDFSTGGRKSSMAWKNFPPVDENLPWRGKTPKKFSMAWKTGVGGDGGQLSAWGGRFEEVAEDFACGEEACGGGAGVQGAHGGAAAAAVEEIGGGIWGDGVFDGGLGGIYAADAGGGAAAGEALAEVAGEGAGVGVGEVGGGEAGGVELAGGAEAGEDVGDAGGLGGEEQFGFREQGVDGVDEDVAGVLGEEAGRGIGVDEEGKGGDGRAGVDVAQEAGGRFGLWQAEGGMEGERMAVEVGRADFVEVDQEQVANGGTGERFGGGGADGAHAGDDDAGACQPGDGGCAEQKLQAFEGRTHRDQPSTERAGRGTRKNRSGLFRFGKRSKEVRRAARALDGAGPFEENQTWDWNHR